VAQPAAVALGALLPLTGPAAPWGRRTWNGIQLACEVVNGQGGVRALGGARLAAAVSDTESRPEVAGGHAERAIAGGAAALIGCNQSAASMAASHMAERAGVAFVTPTDLEPEITARGFAGTFRTAPILDDYARHLLGYVRALGERQGRAPRRLAILSDSSMVGRSAAESAFHAARALGYDVADVEIYEGTSANFRHCVRWYREGGVDVVVGHNDLDAAVRITRAMRDAGFSPRAWGGILGGQASSRYASALGAMATGVLAVAAWSPDLAIPGLSALDALHRERFGERLDAMAAAGVTAVAVLRDALERAATPDRGRLREALAATDLRPGERMCLQLRGVKFLPSGDNGRACGPVLVVRDGAHVPVAPAEYARAVAPYPKPPWAKR
jgi:branched-chain amino acid transport system substrate-binding protein